MMKEIKNKFRSLYWQQFSLIAGIVMLTLLLLGASFYALSYNYLVGEKRDEMKVRAQLIVQMSGEYLTADESDEGGQDSSLSRMAGVASMMTEVNFLICDGNGQALLTTDSDLAGKSIRLPEELQTQILENENGFEGNTTLGGLYRLRQFAVGLPVKTADGQVVGMVLAMIDATQLMRLWRSFTGLFFMISAIVLLISFVASSFMSMRQIQPIKEMLKGTRAYAAGNFDMRIEDEGRGDEIGELARSFNMMADSLSETERQRRDFIANISHELKTPMTSIKVLADSLLAQGEAPAELYREFMEDIVSEIDRENQIINDLLALVKMDKRAQELNIVALSMNDLTELILKRLRPIARKKDVEVVFESMRPVTAEVDEVKMTLIMTNLVENAIKYNREHGWVKVTLDADHQYFMFEVSDSGIGIPESELAHIYERFYRVDKSHSREIGGTGLGLAITKNAVLMHRGSITVTSSEGEGTTFLVKIPLTYIAPSV